MIKLAFLLSSAGVLLIAVAGCVVPATPVPPVGRSGLTPGTAEGLQGQFFGVSTVCVSDGKTSIMLDGFFSRPSLKQVLLGRIASDSVRVDAALARGQVHQLDALLVAHSHYDHALDSAMVAEKTGAVLVGSESTRTIAVAQGFDPARIRIVDAGDQLCFGDFNVTFFLSPHSPKVKFPGMIEPPFRVPARASAYKVAESYSFLLAHPRGRILIVPSANYCPGLFAGVKADVVFLGIGTLGKQSDEFIRTYWKEVVGRTGAKRVIPLHWDNFNRPLDQPLEPMPFLVDDLTRTIEFLSQLAGRDAVEFQFMPLYDKVPLATGPHAGMKFDK